MKPIASGKVREIYAVDDKSLLIVTTDRISAFDVIMPTPVEGKGRILNALSAFWFEKTKDIVPNHMITVDRAQFPAPFCDEPAFEGRAMLVRRLKMLPVECIVMPPRPPPPPLMPDPARSDSFRLLPRDG